MHIKRKRTRRVKVGDVSIGNFAPISIQSMTTTDTRDVKKTLEQIHYLEKAGCELIRVAVPDEDAAKKLSFIKKSINIPLIADIHFHAHLALRAIDQGVDKIRINPGNIGDKKKLKEIIRRAKIAGIPIRIGVNSGSLEKNILNKYGKVTAKALVESAWKHLRFFEDQDFFDIVISIKSSDVLLCIEAYTMLSKKCDYPLHIGVTEAGTEYQGIIKSAIGIGTLLSQGIGDTLRVSLTADPEKEIKAAKEILKFLHIKEEGINIIACPTCGRCEVDMFSIAEKVESKIKDIKHPLNVAIMGCVVNGPGEAKEADIGIACGKKQGIIFKKGAQIKKVAEKDIVNVLLDEIYKMVDTTI
ncbi:MAG: flavodoxin-dependent (E)-4-hydroxy-3-methylbut-2-enyl-diphosphate synthase [Candidatus Firestonebacteria bacterium]|nr:flavodoxin-dependent (E)-4-hydroxy-3-methylbut-2-enyl-diphosphate synthase [Candidatus Firestonebacteria bacterium]